MTRLTWPHPFAWLVAAFVIIALLRVLWIAYTHEDWATFSERHHCRVTEKRAGAVGWLCDDNLIYWRKDDE